MFNTKESLLETQYSAGWPHKSELVLTLGTATELTGKMRKQRQNYNPNGRTRRKAGFGTSESTGPIGNRDPYHNGETPLCRLLNDAVEDIFPELRDNGRNPKRGSFSQPESGSILGQMIRKRYLLARKAHRARVDTPFQRQNMDEDNAWQFNKNTNFPSKNMANDETPPASTTTKKRRKRKKKKKNGSDVSFLPTVITHESGGESHFPSEPGMASSRNGGIDSYNMSDGKSMMSHTDHSLEALDEAVKNEAEKLIEMEANHEVPLLGSLPSDDEIQAVESPSQFIDQIKPEDEQLLKALPDFAGPPPLTDGTESTNLHPVLEIDKIPSNDEDTFEIKWKNPLQLSFLVNFEGKDSNNDNTGNDSNANDGSVLEEPKTFSTVISDKERARIMLDDWIDQSLLANDECEWNGTDEDDFDDSQQGEWDSFLQFCNDRTVGKEKALGIPIKELIDNASSILSGTCRVETLVEINKKIGAKESNPTEKSSRIVMNPTILEKPTPKTDDDKDIDAAFDYVALEEGNHTPKTEQDYKEEEKSDSNISFLATEVTIDSKPKKGNKKKNQTSDATSSSEQFLFLESFTNEQLEELLFEWLIAGVDEEKIVGMSIRNEEEPRENDAGKTAFPVMTSDTELEGIKEGVMKTQMNLKQSLETMNHDLEKMRSEWNSEHAKTSIEKNLDFSGNNIMENCEEACNEFLTLDVLPILTAEFSLPSHACAELQIHMWAVYLEGLAKILNACDAYYKTLEEDLADQNGKLPFIFTSAPLRKIYRDLAEQKIDYLSGMGKSFYNASLSSVAKEFYTRSSWEQRNGDIPNASSPNLDEDCRELIDELTNWTRIFNEGRMSTINRGRSKRLLKVFNMLGVVVESLGEEYKKVERYFSQECQNYFSRLLSNIHFVHGVKDRMRLLEMDDIISLTTGVILMWRHVRIMQSRVAHPDSTETLPLSLRKWVMQESNFGFGIDEMYPFRPDLMHSRGWLGAGGKRRMMGILAGLTYGWLRERCEEWKAEKASQELLTYFDTDMLSGDDPQPANANNTSKSSKKAKKKKNKKSANMANGSSNNPATSSNEIIAESTNAVEEKPEGDAMNANEETKDDNDEKPVEAVECEEDIDDSIEPDESLVVIQDESGCIISAMDFFADRLVELMGQAKNEKIVVILE